MGQDAGCVCTPGEQRSCTCGGGIEGVEHCKTNCRGWEACSCADGGVESGIEAGGDISVEAPEDVISPDGEGDTLVDGQGGTGGTGSYDAPICDAPGDQCPGLPFVLTGSGEEPRLGSVSGTTDLLCGDYEGTCSPSFSAPDVVYHITPDVDGTLVLDLGGSAMTPFDAVLYVRTDCNSVASEVVCKEPAVEGGPGSLSLQVQSGDTYYVFIDGKSGASGSYELNAVLYPVQCGNGVLEGTEECDDGNDIDTDWCKNDCTLNPSPAGNECPGMPLILTGSTWEKTILTSGDTTSFSPTFSASGCSFVDTQSARDIVFEVIPEFSGLLVATLLPYPDTLFDAVLYARSDCLDPTTEITCHDAQDVGRDTIEFSVEADTPYYIFIDGYAGLAYGLFSLEVTLTP